MNNTEIRSLLASFLFTGEDVFKYIRDLSGGEKGRVSLAKLMLSEANFLILDEPTNHLDMVSKEVLENALNHYEGTVLYVSHDRYFINHTASRILSLTKKLMLDYPGHGGDEAPAKYIGNYDFYLEKSAQVEDSLISQEKKRVNEETGGGYQEETFAPSGKAQETPSDGADSWQRQKEEQKEQRKLANALKKVEDRISVLEKENADIDERMADPAIGTDLPKLEDLQKKKDANDEELSGLYDQWEKLQS